MLAPRVQLCEHIVEQEEGRFANHLAHQLQLRQFQGQDQGALLACGAVAAGRLAAEQQANLIAVGPHTALTQAPLLAALGGELVL